MENKDTNIPSPSPKKKSLAEEIAFLENERKIQALELSELENIQREIEKEKSLLEKTITSKMEDEADDSDLGLHLETIRSYQGDIANEIERKKESILTIKLAEEKRSSHESNPDNTSKKIYWLIPLFMASGIGILFGTKYFLIDKVIIDKPPVRENIIAFDETKYLSIKNSKREIIIKELDKMIKAISPSDKKIYEINIKEKTGSTTPPIAIAEIILSPAPDEFTKSLMGKNLVAIYTNKSKSTPFFIFKVSSYENVFASLLLSEKKIMPDFLELINQRKGIEKEINAVPLFEDVYVNNKDARVLKTQFGETVLLYSFIDNETLVIAKDENTLSIITGKYFLLQSVK